MGPGSLKLREIRIEICKTCERFAAPLFCKECGCILEFKVLLSGSECPLGKWKPHEH
jgi:hypothetical protein